MNPKNQRTNAIQGSISFGPFSVKWKEYSEFILFDYFFAPNNNFRTIELLHNYVFMLNDTLYYQLYI